jgi:hypothetical protein
VLPSSSSNDVAMDQVAPMPDTRSVASAAAGCVETFTSTVKFLLDQAEPHTAAELANQRDRFIVWAGNLGVFASTTASVDYRLRGHAELRDVVITLLGRLQRAVSGHQTAVQPSKPLDATAHHGTTVSEAQDVEDSGPASSASSSLQLSSESEDDAQVHDSNHLLVWRRDSPASEIVQDTISRLYRLSTMIRLPLRHTDKTQIEQFTSKHSAVATEGAELADFATFQIQRLAPENSDLSMQPCLVKRLASAVDFRRRRFLYRAKHSDKLRAHMSATMPTAATSPAQGLPALHLLPSTPANLQGSSATPLEFHQSTPSKILSATIASKYDRDGRAFTPSVVSGITSKSTANRRKRLDIPALPKMRPGTDEFVCPYCCVPLEAKDFSDLSWRYVCSTHQKPFVCDRLAVLT